MLHIRIPKKAEGGQVIAKIKEGMKEVEAKNLPIKYLLVHNLVAQWLHESGCTVETEKGYYFDGVKVVHSHEIDFYDYYILTNLQP